MEKQPPRVVEAKAGWHDQVGVLVGFGHAEDVRRDAWDASQRRLHHDERAALLPERWRKKHPRPAEYDTHILMRFQNGDIRSPC
eukprot:5218860-Pleurochrysis_carterae.AAC.2